MQDSYSSLFVFFFFLLTCSHKMGRGIRTSYLRFMRCGPQPIELPIEDNSYSSLILSKVTWPLKVHHQI
jgi:hypothetical protein